MKRVVSLIVVLGLTLMLAACGSSSSTSSTLSTGNSETTTAAASSASSDTQAAMTEITAKLADVSGKPKFFSQEFGKVDAKAALSGKKIMLVAYDSTNNWCVNYVKMANEIYKKIGAKPFITYCDGKADSWISAVQNAINQKYDAIDLFGISDIGQLKNVIEEAKSKGIYVQDTHGVDVTNTNSNTSMSVGCNYGHAGELMALEAIKKVGDPSKVNCLVVADVGWGADDNVRKGITSVFDKYKVKYKMADVSITDWTEGIGKAVRNAFIADKSYNAVIAYYDNMCLYIVPALQELGIDLKTVTIGSFNGNPGLVDYVKQGKLDFNLGESIGWVACHSADCMIRSFAKSEVHNKSGFAMYFIDTDNIDNYLDPTTKKGSYAYDGVQDVYLPGYTDLWGVDLKGVFDGIK